MPPSAESAPAAPPPAAPPPAAPPPAEDAPAALPPAEDAPLAGAPLPSPSGGWGSVVGLTYALEPVDGAEGYCQNSADCWAMIRAINRKPRVDCVAIQDPKD